MKHPAKLTEALAGLGLEPNGPELSALSAYLQLLIDWTERIDLVSPGSPEILVKRHFQDAYAVWKALDARGYLSQGPCVDAGSGAGLPGVVLAVLSPDTRFYLCEPRQKRVVFLQEARRRLGLGNVAVIGKRLEEIESSECAGAGLVTFRALRPEGELLEAALRIAPGGSIAFLTGASERLSLRDGLCVEEISYRVTGDLAGRKIVLVKSDT